ncbi:MAG: hypothetical protein WCW62_09880, partial [Bacteroidales bacterium]
KKQLSMIILVTGLMVSGIVYGDDPVNGSGTDSGGSDSGMGWQEQTRRTSMLWTDGMRISTGPSVGTSGLGWSLNISANYCFIDCCQPTTSKQSWCNYSADDARCDD